MSRPRAFSLLEILFATALIGFAIVTMIGVFMSGLKLVAQGRERTSAIDLARAELEAIQELGFDALPAGTASFDGTPTGLPFPPAPYPGATVNEQPFLMRVEVRPKDTFLKSVLVRVSWGESSQVTLQTLVGP